MEQPAVGGLFHSLRGTTSPYKVNAFKSNELEGLRSRCQFLAENSTPQNWHKAAQKIAPSTRVVPGDKTAASFAPN
jgi:hypothetical protein